jgi:hypothetical protein
MNKVYIVTYDLKVPAKDYTGFYNAIKASPKWWHYLESSWLIYTHELPDGVWGRLSPHVDQSDRILIIEVRDCCQGWLPKDAWDWIHQHAPDP